MIISFLSQKGGSTKSTFARAVATALASNDWSVHIVDFDWQQQTAMNWAQRREQLKNISSIDVSVHRRIDAALKLADTYDALLLDGKAAADKDSIVIAKKSDLVILPCGTSIDDLEPQLKLGQELQRNDVKNLYFVVNKYPSLTDAQNTIDTIKGWNFEVSDHAIPFKTGYSNAMDSGLSIIETKFKTLNDAASLTIGDIVQKALMHENMEE